MGSLDLRYICSLPCGTHACFIAVFSPAASCWAFEKKVCSRMICPLKVTLEPVVMVGVAVKDLRDVEKNEKNAPSLVGGGGAMGVMSTRVMEVPKILL